MLFEVQDTAQTQQNDMYIETHTYSCIQIITILIHITIKLGTCMIMRDRDRSKFVSYDYDLSNSFNPHYVRPSSKENKKQSLYNLHFTLKSVIDGANS